MSDNSRPTVLILAGQRHGRVDPLAEAHGQEHKCLIDLLGRPLLAYVLDAVDAAFPEAPIIVSINDTRALEGNPALAPYLDGGRLTAIKAEGSIPESLDRAGHEVRFPLLITTGDNVLVTGEAYRAFHGHAVASRADGSVLITRKEAVQRVHPQGKPRFWQFRDGAYSNCNTFWSRSAEALDVSEIFRGGGQFLKHPGRFLSAFGLLNLIGYRFGLLSSERMRKRLSRRFGQELQLQVSDNGRFAIDVDDEASYQLTKQILLADRGKA